MRLKSLKIHGFKSFADRTELFFNKDITAVVGLNGCGKSNIVDAIRWVLGEQRTKSLRSDKMDNLIFNGTRGRKGSQRAEVSLTLENNKELLPTEFATVTVTRILYRTGESEYRINNVPCRLKDIKTLFLDSGVSNDSYAIIELAIVSEILNNKDNLRRKLFEQASGISKYKKRKKETFNKLNSTEADLERLEDLLVEIEGNLKSLESQARKANRFNKAKTEYKENSIKMALYRLKDYKVAVKAIDEKRQSETSNKEEIETEIEGKRELIEKLKSQTIEQSKGISDKRKELAELADKIRKEENKKGLLNEKIKFLNDKTEELRVNRSNDAKTIQRLRGEVLELEQKIHVSREKEQEFVEGLKENKDTYESNRATFSEKKEAFNQQEQVFRKLEIDALQIEKEIAIKENQFSNIEGEIARAEKKSASKAKELEALKEQFVNVQKEQAELEGRLLDLVNKQEQREKEINELTEKTSQQKDKLQKLNRTWDAKKNEQKIIIDLIEKAEGVSEAIRFLSQDESWTHRSYLLADVLDCPEKYKIAVESYLKEYLDSFIVETLDEALEGIMLLNKEKKGKANFLIVSELDRQPIGTPLVEGVLRVIDVVSWKPGFEVLQEYLLHKVYITKDDKWTLFSMNTGNPGTVTVNDNGQIFKRKAEISGGSVGFLEGKRIGNPQKLEAIEKKLQQIYKERQGLEESITVSETRLKELKDNSFARQIKNTRQLLEKVQKKTVQCEVKIQNFQQFESETLNRFTQLKQQMVGITSEKEGMDQRRTAFNKLMEEQKGVLKDFERAYIETENILKESDQKYNELNIHFLEYQKELSRIEQQLNFKKSQAADLAKKQEGNQGQIEGTQGEIRGIRSELGNLDQALREQNEDNIEQNRKLQALEKVWSAVQKEIGSHEEEIRNLQDTHYQRDQRMHEIKEEFNKVELKFLGIKERLSIEFGLKMEDLLDQELEEEINIDEVEALVAKLKKRLDSFGEVNPFAVDAYNEMKERYDFMVTQRDDLVEARKILMKTISEIETNASEKFMAAFEQVRENFQLVFRQFFNPEDTCNLILSDPENPLDSEVEIIAKPKGKRPSTINQLSGGEKSLTAISLIFALYLLKPAPFCVLDEVDAPLDDMNTDRFNKVIRSFADRSQFIIVTHKKGTAAASDVLFGVTMVNNISKVVPADMSTVGDEIIGKDGQALQLAES